MRILRKLLRLAAVLIGVVVLAVVVAVGGIELGCRGPGALSAQATSDQTPPPAIDVAGYKRNQASTYYTFPEWYIVYAAEDLGNFVATRNESAFGYLSSIAGFWQSFCTIKERTRGRADPATDVSVMIYTIGLSFTAEYGIKGVYENTIGRLTEWLRGAPLTEEDRFAHRVAQDYAKFLYTIPWYKYPFFTELTRLWGDTSLTGAAIVRKWERKLALSLEYAVKAVYGAAIQKALDVSNGEDPREIMFVVRGLTDDDLKAEPRIKVVKDLGGDARLVEVPRYQVFSDIVVALARKGRAIAEVAGNRDILMTAILPEGAAPTVVGMTPMFAMPLSARPGWRRAGFDVRVAALPAVVRAFDGASITIEHLFDY